MEVVTVGITTRRGTFAQSKGSAKSEFGTKFILHLARFVIGQYLYLANGAVTGATREGRVDAPAIGA